ncbi:MAG: hypothetical protein ACLQJR_17250, partial [Stellaceae bacterium]
MRTHESGAFVGGARYAFAKAGTASSTHADFLSPVYTNDVGPALVPAAGARCVLRDAMLRIAPQDEVRLKRAPSVDAILNIPHPEERRVA